MNPFLRTLISSAWAIDESYAYSLNPIMQKVFSGESVDLSKLINSQSDNKLISANYGGLNIAVIEIEDVLMREDWCGEMGTESIDNLLKEYAENNSIGGVILAFNSPGGQSEYIENVAKTIAEYPKPIVSYVSGKCASAAYWMASSSDAIFTSAKTDAVGSIGTMISYYKINPDSIDQPRYIQVSVYASRSIDKNKAYEEMVNGEHDRVIKELLDPMNAVFLENVQLGRSSIDVSALTGKMYYSNDAIQLGLIDGTKSFEEVVTYVTEMIINSQNSNNMGLFSKNKKPIQMKNELFSTILNREVKDGEILSAEDLQTVQSHIEGLQHLTETPEVETIESNSDTPENPENQPTTENISETISAAISAAINPINERLMSIEQSLEIAPATSSTLTNPVSNDAESFENQPWNDPNRSYNKLSNIH